MMHIKAKNIMLPVLFVILLNLACGLTPPKAPSEDALATQVQMTLAEHAAQQPSGTDEAALLEPSRLLLLDGKSLFSMDVQTMETVSLLALGTFPESHVLFDRQTMSIAFRDENSLRVLDVLSGEQRISLPDEEAEKGITRFTPQAWIDHERLLVQRFHYILDDSEGWSYTSQIGWLIISTGAWQVHPSLADIQIPTDCNAEVALSPDGRLAALALNAHGTGCAPLVPGLHVFDLEGESFQTVVSRQAESATARISGAYEPSWSPDGGWIAFSLYDVPESSTQDQPFAGRLYVVRSNGTDLSLLTNNDSGIASSPVWGPSKKLYYGILHSEDGSDGVYMYDFESQTTATLVESTAAPAAISPDETVLVYMDNIGISHDLKLMSLPTNEIFDIPVPSSEIVVGVRFLGWLPLD